MSANRIFPGVYVTIVDNSQYTESVPGAIGFICIFSQKGEDNRPVLTTSASDLITRYGEGNSSKYGLGWYVAKQYVDILSNLWVMRVLPAEATYANLGIKLTPTLVNKKDEDGNDLYYKSVQKTNGKNQLLYKDAQGNITTDAKTGTVDNTKIMIKIETTETTEEHVQITGSCTAATVLDMNSFRTVANIDSAIADNTADIVFYPKGRGYWYNNYAIKITPSSGSYENTYILDLYIKSDDGETEALAESFLFSLDPEAKDISGESMYLPDVLDTYSSKLNCKMSSDIDWATVSDQTVLSLDSPFTNKVYFKNGYDGCMYDSNGYLSMDDVKDDLYKAYQGLLIDPTTGEDCSAYLNDVEEMDFSVVFDAGYPYDVKNSILTLCDTRDCCFGFLDNGNNATAEKAVSARTTTNKFNDYRVALYEPYTKVYDAFTGKDIWMTPVYHAVSAFCKTARDKNVWWAFAGLQRGTCNGIKDYKYRLAGGYKDQFKEHQINPIMHFTNGGDVIWGNWTSQQTPSALRNIHVVLCLHYIYRTLKKNLKQYIFEFNDETTWTLIKENISSFLSQIQNERALEYYSVSVSATDYQKRNNQCQVDVNLRVTNTIETINVSLIAE